MTEPVEQANPPLRTWRPMAAWTGAILLILGLAWFVGAVVVPVWQTRRVVLAVYAEEPVGFSMMSRHAQEECRKKAIATLGGPERAATRLKHFLMLPEWANPKRSDTMPPLAIFDIGPRGEALELLGHCGRSGAIVLAGILDGNDTTLCPLAALELGEIGPEAEVAAPALIRKLGDNAESVRSAAAEALKKIRGEEAKP